MADKKSMPSGHSKKLSYLALFLAAVALLALVYSGLKMDRYTDLPACEDLCGDGICQEIVCKAVGCPCLETKESCPIDCIPKNSGNSVAPLTEEKKIVDITSESYAKDVMEKYVKGMYCYMNYGGHSQERLSFSDEGDAKFFATYRFEVEPDLLEGRYDFVEVNLTVRYGVVIGADVAYRKEPFCGASTRGECAFDDDCKTGGCSGQVCQSAKEASLITTCEWKACYNSARYKLSCKCVDGECLWA
jgi:eight-cysteine-cluster-containing protein